MALPMSEAAVEDALEGLQTVERVVEYQTPEADISAVLTPAATSTQEVRVHYLRELRDEWHWVDDFTSEQAGAVLLRRRRD